MTGLEDHDFGLAGYLLPELIEGASRCGQHAIAADAFGRLLERAEATQTPTALGMAALGKALLNDGDTANDDYLDPIVLLEHSPLVVCLARARLVYGEWLRRVNRRAEARIQLRIAHDMFLKMELRGFAARAGRELEATGEIVRNHAASTPMKLTNQERHITRLVCEGHTNSEIGAQLFISPRTVEWHLGRIIAKVGVKTRRELQREIGRLQSN